MNRIEMLEHTMNAYYTLAVNLKSPYYFRRFRETFQLLKKERSFEKAA